MATDSHPHTTGRCGALARALGTALAAAAVLGTGGCLFAEPETAGMTVENDSDHEVSIFVNESTAPRATVPPGATWYMATSGRAGTCMDWQLKVRTADVVITTFGPPVCDGDEWEIAKEDVDAAVEGE